MPWLPWWVWLIIGVVWNLFLALLPDRPNSDDGQNE